MKNVLVFCAIILACCAPALADSNDKAAEEVLDLERAAMDGWIKGDPDPSLAICDPEITYIHAVAAKRLDGLDAGRALFKQYRGTPLLDSYEIVDPKVQMAGEAAILTYTLVRHNGDAVSRWNGTQVYQRKTDGWRVIHSHWS